MTGLALAAFALLAGCATTSGFGSNDSAKTRENAARIHTELAHGLMNQGKLKAALQKLKIALQFDADYAPAHTVLGALYSRIGNTAMAGQNYRRAVELDPKAGNTNNNYGTFLCHGGQTKQGLGYLKKALADPFYQTPEVAWTNAGICELQRSDTHAARSDFDHALTLAPKYPAALYQMAQLLYDAGDAFHASAFMQRYQALGHSSATALALGYEIARRLGDEEGAQNYARQLRTRFPDSKQARALNSQ